MNCKKQILRYIALLMMFSFVLIFSGCGSDGDTSLLPAFGAGRIVTEPPEETKSADPEPTTDLGITICVDPGHGYEDGGTSSELLGDTLEKDINLSVSLKLKKYLEEYGFDVVMTHDGESFPKTSIDDGNDRFKPEERAAYANSLGDTIDYYISLHCNAFDTPDVSGTIVYYVEDATKGTDGDTEIAAAVTDKLTADFKDTKVSSSVFPYYVIRYTKVPASLVEMGFVTNETDAANLLDEVWQDKFAKSLADALNSYYSADTADATDSSDDTSADISVGSEE